MAGVVAFSPGAHADDADIVFDAQGVAHRTLHAEGGQLAEYCGRLEAHRKVRWSFESSSVVDFNIHFHSEGKVTMPAQADAVSTSRGVFDPASAQDFCWMWTNKGASTATIDVTLKREN